MRPRTRRLAPQGQNHQAAPPRPSGGGVRGPGGSPLSLPPRPKSGRRPAGETAAPHPPGGAAAPRGGRPRPRQVRPRTKRPWWTARTLSHYPLPTDNGTAAPRKAQTERPTQRPAWGRRRRGPGRGDHSPPPSPPPRHTDPQAADRAAPNAHGLPATPTAPVYPRGARRRQRMTGAGATGHQTGKGGGEQRTAPPPPPPPLPPRPASRRSAVPPPPRSRRGRSPSPEGTTTPGGGRSWTRTPRAPAPPTACSRGGRGRRGRPQQRAGAMHGPRPGAARNDEPEQYGGRAPGDQSIASDTRSVAHSGRAEGQVGSVGAPGGAVHGPPPPPPPPGRLHPVHGVAPRPRPNALTGGGMRRRREGGRVGSRRPPPRGRAGGPRRNPPPPPPPTGPQAAGAPAPTPRGRGDGPPSPRQDRGARERGRSKPRPPTPAACSHSNRGEQANPHQRARAPHEPRPETAGEHEPRWYGGHALHDQSVASDTGFVACQWKAEGWNEAELAPAPLARLAAQTGGMAHRPPPPTQPQPPARDGPWTRRPTPRGEHNPKPGRGESGPGCPPPSTPNGARDRGRTRRGARTAWNGPTSA